MSSQTRSENSHRVSLLYQVSEETQHECDRGGRDHHNHCDKPRAKKDPIDGFELDQQEAVKGQKALRINAGRAAADMGDERGGLQAEIGHEAKPQDPYG